MSSERKLKLPKLLKIPKILKKKKTLESDLEKKFAGLKESSDLEDEKQKSETTNVKDFAVRLGLDKFKK